MSYNYEQKHRISRESTQTQTDGRHPHLQHGCTQGEDMPGTLLTVVAQRFPALHSRVISNKDG